MYSVQKDFTFSASHQLLGLPDDHPCSRLHGHNYKVRLTLYSAELDEVGFVYDYRELDKFKRFLDDECDHRHLNDVFRGMNPTAENLANQFYAVMLGRGFLPTHCQLRVDVSETDKTWASYEPDVLIGAGE